MLFNISKSKDFYIYPADFMEHNRILRGISFSPTLLVWVSTSLIIIHYNRPAYVCFTVALHFFVDKWRVKRYNN